MTKPAAHPWSFKSKFRRNAFGWRGTRTAIDRIAEALAEIRDSGRSDPAVAGSVPFIASAPVTESVRQKWLERLFEAYQDDSSPYIESLADHWGKLCATSQLASRWADELLPLVRRVMAERSSGDYAYTKSSTPCHSALLKAG